MAHMEQPAYKRPELKDLFYVDHIEMGRYVSDVQIDGFLRHHRIIRIVLPWGSVERLHEACLEVLEQYEAMRGHKLTPIEDLIKQGKGTHSWILPGDKRREEITSDVSSESLPQYADSLGLDYGSVDTTFTFYRTTELCCAIILTFELVDVLRFECEEALTFYQELHGHPVARLDDMRKRYMAYNEQKKAERDKMGVEESTETEPGKKEG